MSEEKKHGEERRYAVLSKESIRMFAEAAGYAEIPDEVASVLAEDVTYRLREMAQNSCQFMRHGKRKKLTSEDVNRSLRNSDSQPLFGHGSSDGTTFRQTKEGELYFVEDLDITLANIACSNHPPHQLGATTVKGQWLSVEGIQKSGSLSLNLTGKTSGKIPHVSEDLMQYYDNVTKAILGTDEEIMKLALVDLRTNSKIAALLPYLVNFVSNGVRTVSHDITQLTKLLHTVRALVSNPSLFLEPKPYLDLLVKTVMYCVVEPLAASINPLNDHWSLRDYAARLLAQITWKWDSLVSNLKEQNANCLKDVLYDLSKPFCSHYGAVMGLVTFGMQAVEDILLPHLPIYWTHLMSAMEDMSCGNAQAKADAHKVHGAIMTAAEYLVLARSHQVFKLNESAESGSVETVGKDIPSVPSPITIKPEPSTSTPVKAGITFSGGDLIGTVLELPEITNPYKLLANTYQELYQYFGDGLAARLPHHFVKDYYASRKDKVRVSLGDGDSKKSGDELLQQFLGTKDVKKVETKHESAKEAEELKSENGNHSFEPNIDDADLTNDGDEKSVRSERSSRSSRSERSHSDESYSGIGEDTDLTVKATVSESLGIKLTIMKRPKTKSISEDEKKTAAGPSKTDSRKRRRKDSDSMSKVKKEPLVSLAFEKTGPKRNPPVFVFRFLGREQKSNLLELRRKSVPLTSPVAEPVVANMCYLLNLKMKPTGPLRKVTGTRKSRRKLLALHHCTAGVDSFL